MGRLDGATAVITGGASGIGRASAELFLQEGASVVIGDLNPQGERLVAELADAGHGKRVRFVQCDVAKEDELIQLIDTATSCFGRLDVMFNNAGVEGAFGPLIEISVEHWDQTFAINARGVFLGIKHAARVMTAQASGGSIINTASIAGLTSGSGALVYSATKAAVIRLSQSAALELAPHRIRVNSICPGVIYTPLMHRGKPDRADVVMRANQPLPFRGEGTHIAHAALFLAGPESEFVTGHALVVDGGLLSVGPLSATPMVTPSPTAVGMRYGTTGISSEIRPLADDR